MKYIYPDYYESFRCIADKCPCTCCAGMLIEIDDDSLEKYQQFCLDNIDYTEQTFLQDSSPEKRCLNLTESGLCKLILSHGESILCDTCRLFPRHIEEFRGVREYSLSISCPVAAETILSLNHPMKLTVKKDDIPDEDEYDEYEQEVYNRLLPVRSEMIHTLQDSEFSLSDKCRQVLSMAAAAQDEIDGMSSEDFCDSASVKILFDVMEQWEYTSDMFPELLKKVKSLLPDEINSQNPLNLLNSDIEDKLQRIIVYFIYAFFCGSVYDEYYYGMAQLAVGAAIHIKLLCDAHKAEYGELSDGDIVRYTYLYARELEHSVPNMLLTEQWMDEHRLR